MIGKMIIRVTKASIGSERTESRQFFGAYVFALYMLTTIPTTIFQCMFRCVSDRLSNKIKREIGLIEKQFIVCIIALAFVIVVFDDARESSFSLSDPNKTYYQL